MDQRMLKNRLAVALEVSKVQTIEADEAIFGTQPEESVTGLRNREHGRLEQPFFMAPDAMRILGETFGRIQSEGGGHQDHSRDDNTKELAPQVNKYIRFQYSLKLCQMA